MVSYKVGDMTTNEIEKRTSIKFHTIYGKKRDKSMSQQDKTKKISQ